MKKYLLAFFLLLPFSVQAQIIPTLPVTLTNGTLADANQVMSNFNTIVTGVNTNGAKNGVNSDITALNGLTTPITPAQGGTNVYIGAGSGSANAQLVVTPTPNGFALVSGYTVNYLPSVGNSGAATLSVAGTTAKNVLRQTSSGLQPLAGGEIIAGQMATVIYDGTQYELINSAGAAFVQPCTVIDAAGVSVPTGYLQTDGTLKSRAAFPALFSCLNTTVSATTSSGSPTVTVTSTSGIQLGYSVGGTNTVCNTTVIGIPDGTHITLANNASGNGATTLTIGPWPQGDCSTTFAVPNFSGRGTVMADVGGATLSATACPNPGSVGSRCGSTTQTILTANLPPYTPAGNVASNLSNNNILGFTTPGTNVGVGGTATGGTAIALVGNQLVGSSFTGTAQGGTSTPFLLQPVGLVFKAIKF